MSYYMKHGVGGRFVRNPPGPLGDDVSLFDSIKTILFPPSKPYRYVYRNGKCVSVNDWIDTDPGCPTAPTTTSSSATVSAGSPSTLSKIGSGLFEGLSLYGKAQADRAAAAQAAAYRPSGTPGWVMPVALGGVALVAVILLKKKKAP